MARHCERREAISGLPMTRLLNALLILSLGLGPLPAAAASSETLRPENTERAGLEEDLRGALAAGETSPVLGAAPLALDVPQIHTLADAVLQYGTQLQAVYRQLHPLRDYLRDLRQWSALHGQAEELLLKAYWAQLDLLAALGAMEMVVYPAIGGDLSVARVAHRVLGIDSDAGRDRVEIVFQQELEPFLPDAERHGVFEEWWRRITLLPKTVGTAGDAPELHRFIQDARDEGRPVTLFLKGFTHYVESASEREPFLDAVEPQLHAGDFVVFWGRDLPLADRFRRLGYVEALGSLGVPPAIRETLRQADGLLEEQERIYNRDAQLYLHFARPFVILQKPLRALPPAAPRAGLEEAAFGRAEALLDGLRKTPPERSAPGFLSWKLQWAVPLPADPPLSALMQMLLDLPDPAAAKTKVREMLKVVDDEVLPALRDRSVGWAFALPTADDWLVYPLLPFYKDEELLIARARALTVYSPRAAALLLGLLGQHLRDGFLMGSKVSDAVDARLYPIVLGAVMPHLQRMFEQADQLHAAGRLADAAVVEAALRDEARALVNGLVITGLEWTPRESPQDAQSLLGYRELFWSWMDAVKADVSGVSSPEAVIGLAMDLVQRTEAGLPAFVTWVGLALGSTEVRVLAMANERPDIEPVSAWDFVTGTPRGAQYYQDQRDPRLPEMRQRLPQVYAFLQAVGMVAEAESVVQEAADSGSDPWGQAVVVDAAVLRERSWIPVVTALMGFERFKGQLIVWAPSLDRQVAATDARLPYVQATASLEMILRQPLIRSVTFLGDTTIAATIEPLVRQWGKEWVVAHPSLATLLAGLGVPGPQAAALAAGLEEAAALDVGA